jgi:tight adherence protein B
MTGLIGELGNFTAVIMLGVALSVLLLFTGLASSLGGERKRRERRIARALGASRSDATSDVPRAPTMRLDHADSAIETLDKLIKRLLPNPAKLRGRLASTGRRIQLGEYVLASGLIGLLAYVLVAPLGRLPPLVGLSAAIAFGLGLPHASVGLMIGRRLKQFTLLFPDAIELIVRGLRSGLPVTESIRVVGQEMPDPIGVEFRKIASSIGLGQTLEQALWAAATRLDTPEFRFFVISLAVQQETGGNLAETLENLANILRRRKQMKLKVKALSSEARASATIIGSLPFVMFGLLTAVNPDYMLMLIRDPRGHTLLAVALASLGSGVAVMFKMARFEI